MRVNESADDDSVFAGFIAAVDQTFQFVASHTLLCFLFRGELRPGRGVEVIGLQQFSGKTVFCRRGRFTGNRSVGSK